MQSVQNNFLTFKTAAEAATVNAFVEIKKVYDANNGVVNTAVTDKIKSTYQNIISVVVTGKFWPKKW